MRAEKARTAPEKELVEGLFSGGERAWYDDCKNATPEDSFPSSSGSGSLFWGGCLPERRQASACALVYLASREKHYTNDLCPHSHSSGPAPEGRALCGGVLRPREGACAARPLPPFARAPRALSACRRAELPLPLALVPCASLWRRAREATALACKTGGCTRGSSRSCCTIHLLISIDVRALTDARAADDR